MSSARRNGCLTTFSCICIWQPYATAATTGHLFAQSTVYGVAQSWTRLKRLSGGSSRAWNPAPPSPSLCITLQEKIKASCLQGFCSSHPVVLIVQSLSPIRLFATPWTAARQASLSFTIPWSLLKLMSIESVMLLNHLILCRPLLRLPSIFPSIRVFSNVLALRIRWLKYWSFSFSITPSNEYS